MPAGFHFHDLRHTGNHLAAASGASTRELMHRMGHASMRAALIYQHATSDRHREIAESMDKRIAKGAKPKARIGVARANGTPMARKITRGVTANGPGRRKPPLTRVVALERATRIELA
ncbi:hypothetical protein ACTOB_001184 [Actinoplanes oblitus]|uniref:Tyr recombinase domain-containing protein n=1 Tax=Actinoplanes oblitus TaxID=3040509 RepID=A0ABY8WJH9_9ACTN|nr:hypothetical protein [Actinoplanes oblitus]WIM97642.1 hypothetical protein ACTOB_001184 [Actinoplanes oblitus]